MKCLSLPLAACLLVMPQVGSAQTCTEVTITSPAPSDALVQSEATCSGCDSAGVSTITFRFDREVPCGTFVDGSPWVAGEGAAVNIVEISPPVTNDCGGDHCNGWMTNVGASEQALDSRNSYDAAQAPPIDNPSVSEPYAAAPGTSLLKAVSMQDEIVGAGCNDESVFGRSTRNCIYFAGVLTVLDAPPPDGTGAGYFRPPYVGTDKPLIAVSEARLDRLPNLPTTGLAGLPDLATSETRLCAVPLEFMGTYRAQFLKGYLNSVEHPSGYHGHVSRSQGDYLLRALFEDRTDRIAACLVQRGIDLYHMTREPVSVSWNPNGGHGQGRTMWGYLAAALLGRDDWAAEMTAMAPGRFAERSQIYWSPLADPEGAWGDGPGEVLYGAHPSAGGTGFCQTSEYIGRCYPDWPGSCNRVCADPFAYIDGGPPGGSYQAIFTPAAKAYALAARLIPDLAAAWPRDDGHPLFLEYMDRWVSHGAWASPDPCDATTPLDPASADDCASMSLGSCLCNAGGGRYTDRHGTSADGGTAYRSNFAGEVWDLYRGCADDCSCAGMEGLCAPPPEVDAGAPDVDAGARSDAGRAPGNDANAAPLDAEVPTIDAGPGSDPEPGCACRAGGRSSPWALALVTLALLVSVARRRRR